MKIIFFVWLFFSGVVMQAQKTIIWEESFKNNDHKWWTGTTEHAAVSVTKGKYVYEKKTPGNNLTWANLPVKINPAERFKIETKIKLLNTKDNGPYTVIWDVKDANNFYGFSVYPDGGSEFIRCVNGKYSSLYRYSSGTGPKKTAREMEYKIDIQLYKGSASFYINDIWLSGVRYDGHLTTNVGFLLTNEKKVEIDYVRIYQDAPVVVNTRTDKKDLYPVIRDINDKIFNTAGASNYLYVGCAEGNCNDGEGTFIAVSSSGYGTGPEHSFTHLNYWVVKGRFSDNGNNCNGQTYYRYVKVAKQRKNSPWKPDENWKYDRPGKDMIPVYTGELSLGHPFGDNTVNLFYPNGNGSYIQGSESPWESCKGLFFYGSPLYVSIRYRNAQPFVSFDGYVSSSFTPEVGAAVYANGDVYEGSFTNFKRFGAGRLVSGGKTKKGFWADDELLQPMEVFVPDTSLLRSLYNSQQRNRELTITYNPFYYYRSLMKGTITGRFVGEDGRDKDAAYTGNGLFVENGSNVYFGAFVNGKPDGTGFYSGGNNPTVFGFFKAGIFTGGGEEADVPADQYGRTKQGVKRVVTYPGDNELFSGWQLMQAGKRKEGMALYEQAAGEGNFYAMVQLGCMYFNGDGVAKNKPVADEWFKKAADSRQYDLIRRIADLYATDPEWYKKAAYATEQPNLKRECINRYYSVKYPYLLADDYRQLTLEDEAKVPDAASYARIQEKKKRDKELYAALARRSQLQTKIILYTETSIGVVNQNDVYTKGLYLPGNQLQMGDYIWTNSRFSEVSRNASDRLMLEAAPVNEYTYYRVIRGYIPVPYYEAAPPCYKCGGTGGTQGGTLTGGGLVSGHTTTITPTIVGGVSKVTTTTTYGPPMSIYIPPTLCKVCKGHKGEPRNATMIRYGQRP